MKLAIMSDLHLEFDDTWTVDPDIDADVFVIAGDLHTKFNGLRWLQENLTDKPVIYILGNHEYYRGQSIDHFPGKIKRRVAEWEMTNVHFLEDDFVDIDGVRFIGSTLWTDYRLLGDPHVNMMIANENMNDFEMDGRKNIRKGYGQRIHPNDFALKHATSKRFIFDNIVERTVVVTHHAPSGQSCYELDSLSPAYASELGWDISGAPIGPKLWIHGHTHQNVDYMIHNTRVLAHQRGYAIGKHRGYADAMSYQPKVVEV